MSGPVCYIGITGAMQAIQCMRDFIAAIIPSGRVLCSVALSGPTTTSTFEAQLYCDVSPNSLVSLLKTSVLLLYLLVQHCASFD